MKLRTLNTHPALFFDLRALVEKAANLSTGLDAIGVEFESATDSRPAKGKLSIITLPDIAAEAQRILEKFKKLEAE